MLSKRQFSKVIVSSVLFLPLALTQDAIAKSDPLPDVQKGAKLYTRFSLYFEELCHRTTNYRKGILLPVNAEVVFVRCRKNDIIVAIPGGQELTIENIKDYSGEDINGIFNRTFSPERTDLSAFTEDEVKAIKAGEVRPGMRKAAVLVALGYPPNTRPRALS